MTISSTIIEAIRANVDINPETRRLISLARWDLYNGPVTQEQADASDMGHWPGFEIACCRIRDALPSHDWWVNVETGHAQDSEPIWTCACGECEGTGVYHGPYDEQACDECDGSGQVSCEIASDWVQVDARDARKAIVGNELANYL